MTIAAGTYGTEECQDLPHANILTVCKQAFILATRLLAKWNYCQAGVHQRLVTGAANDSQIRGGVV